jgi:hypothetical protein
MNFLLSVSGSIKDIKLNTFNLNKCEQFEKVTEITKGRRKNFPFAGKCLSMFTSIYIL